MMLWGGFCCPWHPKPSQALLPFAFSSLLPAACVSSDGYLQLFCLQRGILEKPAGSENAELRMGFCRAKHS